MRRLLPLLAILTMALGGTVACGDDDPGGIATANGTDSDGAAGEAELTDHEQALAFTECMRENGVDMPDPDPGGGIVMQRSDSLNLEDVQRAREACNHLAPEGLRGGQMDPETLDQLREFTQCMRDNGIDMPDPDPDGGAFRVGGEDGVDPSSPEFEAAMEACEDVLAGLDRGGMRR